MAAAVTGPFFNFNIDETESDSGIGFFVNGGVLVRLGRRFQAGVDLRYSDVTIDFDVNASGDDLDVGGLYYGAFVGFRWGEWPGGAVPTVTTGRRLRAAGLFCAAILSADATTSIADAAAGRGRPARAGGVAAGARWGRGPARLVPA